MSIDDARVCIAAQRVWNGRGRAEDLTPAEWERAEELLEGGGLEREAEEMGE